MQRLFAFLYRYRVFGYFLLLELLCGWLLTRYNRYYNASLFNSSNLLAGRIQSGKSQIQNYISLKEINAELAAENARLRQWIAEGIRRQTAVDSAEHYAYLSARVINNDYRRSENYLTVNKGLDDGIKPGMGVISPSGVAGVVKSCSRHFSTVTSLLHQELMVSSELARSHTLCTTQWDARDPLSSQIKYLPRHIPVSVGDSVVTSGFNSIFPPGLLIGTISELDLPSESPFYEARIQLATDFTSLSMVYLIINKFKPEIDSLEQAYD